MTIVGQLLTPVSKFYRMSTARRLATFLVFCFCGHIPQLVSGNDAAHFQNEWAVHIPGGARVARDVAEQYGFAVVRPSLSFPDHYVLERADTPRRARREALQHTRSLTDDSRSLSFPDHYVLERADTPRRARREALQHTRSLTDDSRVAFAEQQQLLTRVKRDVFNEIAARDIAASKGIIDDPEFSHEWYINQAFINTRRRDLAVTDLRVKDVWRMGITGKNVVATIVDDGLESNHSDLKSNYDPQASYDLNDHDDDPFPRYDKTNENKHGTRCAGVVSMSANNNICGAGIAFDSKIGGIRLLDGGVNDRLEAESLAFRNDHIDIYSVSWGPTDNGKTLDGPRTLSRRALNKGVKEGRGGKGNLYVWASGNGGYADDCCSADGYASAVETLSVSSSTQDGSIPRYAEKCPSTLTTAYSSGSHMDNRVVSTDLHNLCTLSHSGTSASAPMVAGILALLLEVNPNITWRDAQHIVVHTSNMEPLARAGGWYRNGAGYCVNLAFGFGLIDALGVVQLGDPRVWKGVGEQVICEVEPEMPKGFPHLFQSAQSVAVEFKTDACAGRDNEINFLEHVAVVVSVEHQRRGNVYAELRSPMGTVSPLMLERQQDDSTKEVRNWPWISTHNWGERPRGTWTLRVGDRNISRSSQIYHGSLKKVTLLLYGTKHQPEYQKSGPRNCRLDEMLMKGRMKQ